MYIACLVENRGILHAAGEDVAAVSFVSKSFCNKPTLIVFVLI